MYEDPGGMEEKDHLSVGHIDKGNREALTSNRAVPVHTLEEKPKENVNKTWGQRGLQH